MKKIKFNFLYILGLMLVLSSCESDLNVVPEDDDLYLADDFYMQPGAYEQALGGVYGNFSLTGANGAESSFLGGIDAGTSQYGRCLLYLQTLSADEMIWTYENDPGTKEIQRSIWTSSNPLFLGMYSRAMVEVALVNEFLKQSTPEKLSARGVSASDVAKIDLYRKEVRVLRALAYYHLMDLFGKATFVTENDPVNFAGPQYDRQQLFDFIEQEINAVLPDLKPARTNEAGRVDQGVAHMILAKIYLNAEAYDVVLTDGRNGYSECAAQCEIIIGSGYALNSNYLNNFKKDNETSPEMIWTFESDGTYTQNYGPTTVMLNGQVGSLEKNGTPYGVGATGWGGALRIREQFANKFAGPEYNNDTRNTIISEDRPIVITSVTNPDQGYIVAKYSNVSSTGTPGTNSTFVDTDFPVFRLGDVFLMYAECAVRGASGTTMAQGVVYVNQLQERANNGSTNNNISESDLTLDFLIDERSRELYWEGHRRQDLIRFGKFTGGNYNWAWKGNGQSGIAIPSNFNVFPMPQGSLDANPNLTQNPGY
jgi:hypothetical protein